MTKFNEEERNAGTLILSKFKMFNESVAFFEQYIDSAFWKGFDASIKKLIDNYEWTGKVNFSENEYIWFSPKHWLLDPKTKDCKYWFQSYLTPNEGLDYYLSVITHTSTEQVRFGIQFTINSHWIGGAAALKNYCNNLDKELLDQILELGFENQGKGNFFLPINLDLNLIIECWKNYGEFPHTDEAFAPLEELIKKIEKSIPILDKLFSSVKDN